MTSLPNLHDAVERDVAQALYAALQSVTDGLVREALGTPEVQTQLRALVAQRLQETLASLSEPADEPAAKKPRR